MLNHQRFGNNNGLTFFNGIPFGIPFFLIIFAYVIYVFMQITFELTTQIIITILGIIEFFLIFFILIDRTTGNKEKFNLFDKNETKTEKHT